MNEPVCSGCYDNLCKTSYLADGQRLTRGAVARAHHHILCDLCRTVSYSYYNNKVNIIWRSAQTLTLFFFLCFSFTDNRLARVFPTIQFSSDTHGSIFHLFKMLLLQHTAILGLPRLHVVSKNPDDYLLPVQPSYTQ